MFTNRYRPVTSTPYYAHKCIAGVAHARTSDSPYNDNLMSVVGKTYYENDKFLLIPSMQDTLLYTSSFEALTMGCFYYDVIPILSSLDVGIHSLSSQNHKILEKLWHLITIMGEQNAFFFLFISSGLSNNTIQFLPQVYVSGVSVGLVRD